MAERKMVVPSRVTETGCCLRAYESLSVSRSASAWTFDGGEASVSEEVTETDIVAIGGRMGEWACELGGQIGGMGLKSGENERIG